MTLPKPTSNCAKCFKAIPSNSYSIGCHGYSGWFHKGDCSGLTVEAMKKISIEQKQIGFKWLCYICSQLKTPPSKLINEATVKEPVKEPVREPVKEPVINNGISPNSTIVLNNNNAKENDVINNLKMHVNYLTSQITLLNMIISEKDKKYKLCAQNIRTF